MWQQGTTSQRVKPLAQEGAADPPNDNDETSKAPRAPRNEERGVALECGSGSSDSGEECGAADFNIRQKRVVL